MYVTFRKRAQTERKKEKKKQNKTAKQKPNRKQAKRGEGGRERESIRCNFLGSHGRAILRELDYVIVFSDFDASTPKRQKSPGVVSLHMLLASEQEYTSGQ